MKKCKHCSEETSNPTFCSNKCQIDYQRKSKITKFLEGAYVGKKVQFRTGEWTRNLIINTYGEKCNCCGLSEWNNKPIILEVNHIDGKAYNNIIENLELLCPNCHSQTETFRNKNNNSDRKYR